MKLARALQIRCSAENGLAECERNAAAPLTATEAGKKAGEVAGAMVRAKSAGTVNEDDERRSAEGKASGRGRGKGKPAAPSQGCGGNGHEDVKSVAELIATICNQPDNRKKRLKLTEALRERGLDESKVAAMYSGLAEKLSRSKESGAVGVAIAKLLFDVLKELADWLEPQKTAGSSEASAAPQFVRLIHNVPRPVRTE